jgi:flagellar motility protein MotE (MotC chaperone)
VSSSVLLDILGSLVAIVLAGAGGIGAWAALRVGRNTQTVTNYREAARSWQAKSESQDAEIAELQRENADLRKQVADLSGQVAVLRDMITGTSILTDHDGKVTAYHKEVMGQLTALLALVKEGRPDAA